MFAFYWADLVDADPLGTAFYWFLKNTNIWLWLMAILGYARRYLNFSTKALQYANEAVYPFYILHQTVIVCIAYYMINWQASIAVKYTLICIGMFLICWLLYEFLIKRTNLTRMLFGLKPLLKTENTSLTKFVEANTVL
jgi:peptidoglycan/LPS O-acetylase OafA/YrhL